jgi:uncharacterized protein VirK/YbjX
MVISSAIPVSLLELSHLPTAKFILRTPLSPPRIKEFFNFLWDPTFEPLLVELPLMYLILLLCFFNTDFFWGVASSE